jgi:Patatin-like phospholipase
MGSHTAWSSTLDDFAITHFEILARTELSAVSCGFVASLVCMGFVVWVQLYLTRAEIARKDPPDLFLPTKILFFDRVFARARRHSSNRARGWAEGIMELVENIPEDVLRGYFGSVQIDTERSRSEENRTVAAILPGHIAASVLLMLTLLAYAVLGAIKYFSLGYSPVVPTLCYILILAMLFCWALSSLTFFLDRYRIPVLIPVAAWLAITSILPWSDYFYPLLSPKDSNDEVALETRSVTVRDEEPYGDSIIVVAANGGGIQAAAWTAQVLTGLEERCRKECDQQFDEKIRLISAVSGGSVGTMYFVNEYEDGRIDPTEKLRNIVKRVEGSSLDEIAWGVLYPDLWHTFIPFPFKWDRGRALEWAWLRQDIPWKGRTGIQKGLSDWRADTQAGDRPAVIFNSTIADSGQRLPLATTDLPKGVPGKVIYDQFVEQIKPKDITIVTAARLSASFPYVSPAARAAGVKGEGSHIVDGGYYDNYGISSLAEWLDQELTDHEEIKKVLIIEIRGAPSSSSSTDDDEKDEDDKTCPPSPTDAPDRTSNQRWFYQLVAPLSTVLNVRKTGQRGHNDVELNLLVDKWDRKGEEEGERRVAITRALFEFDHLHTPLSWHLTAAQKQRIKDNWSEEFDLSYNRCAGWEKVKAFLAKDKANE